MFICLFICLFLCNLLFINYDCENPHKFIILQQTDLQFSKYIIISPGADGEPLSVFQLQKDIWAKAKDLGGKRSTIRRKLVEEMTDIIICLN